MQIQNAKDIVNPWTAWFFYGDTGTGKSHSMATFPRLITACPSNEGSALTFRGLDVDYAEIRNRSDMLEFLHFLEVRHAQLLNMPQDATNEELDAVFPWQTVGVESVSHYCDLLIEDISQRGNQKMDYSKWGELSGHIRSIHSRLRNLQVHVVYTSLAKTDEASGGSPLMTGKNAVMLPSACDYLGYCEAVPGSGRRPPKYRIHFAQYGRFPARARQSPALRAAGMEPFPTVVDDFTFDKVRPFCGL